MDTKKTRLRGRAPRGERLVARVPHGPWKTTSVIAGLGLEGMRCATQVDGAVNRDVFEAFVGQVLVPVLCPGDVVILDNLSSYKGPRTPELIRAAGASLVSLPPYSPDLNPIELAFSNIKQYYAAWPTAPSTPSGKPCKACSSASRRATRR